MHYEAFLAITFPKLSENVTRIFWFDTELYGEHSPAWRYSPVRSPGSHPDSHENSSLNKQKNAR